MDRRNQYKAKNTKNTASEMRLAKEKQRATTRNNLFLANRIQAECEIEKDALKNTPAKGKQQQPKTRQQLYYDKFLAWKKEKDKNKPNGLLQKPFTSAVTTGRFLIEPNQLNVVTLKPNGQTTKSKDIVTRTAIRKPLAKKETVAQVIRNKRILPNTKMESHQLPKKQLKANKKNPDPKLCSEIKIKTPLNKKNKKSDPKIYNEIKIKTPLNSSKKNPDLKICNQAIMKTPLKTDDAEQMKCNEINYVSPFVTTSRGKFSARKEKKIENISVIESIPNLDAEEQQKNYEAAQYFTNQLEMETNRLLAIASEWEQYKIDKTTMLQSEFIDMIDVAIGQTRLLTSKKFQQFKGLIEQCRNGGTGIQKVLPDDLEGFWSMMYIQVEHCTNRFIKLDKFKENNWIDPDVFLRPRKAKRNAIKKINEFVAPKRNGALLNLLADARKWHTQSKEYNSVMNPLFTSTPVVLEKGQLQSMAGMATTLKGKSARKLINSPAKSILKTPGKNRTSKSVIFVDEQPTMRKNSIIASKMQTFVVEDIEENTCKENVPENIQIAKRNSSASQKSIAIKWKVVDNLNESNSKTCIN